MTQVSRYPIRKDIEQRMFEIFWKSIASLSNRSDIENFLEDFLSPVEKIMLAKRLSIAVLLSKGYTYPAIREILRVTPSTIAAVSVNLKYANKGYQKVVDKILRDEKTNKFYQNIEDLLANIPPSKGGDWSYWRKEYEKKKRIKKKAF